MKCLFERLLEVIIAALHNLPLRALAADSAEMQPLVFQVFPPRYISAAEEEDKKVGVPFFLTLKLTDFPLVSRKITNGPAGVNLGDCSRFHPQKHLEVPRQTS